MILLLYYIFSYNLVLSESNILEPTKQYEEMKEVITSVLKENQCRLAIILKHSDAEQGFCEEISQLLSMLQLPQMNIEETSIGYFNGEYDNKFSYNAIIDESRIYFIFLPNITSALHIIPTLERIYFFRSRHRIILLIDQSLKPLIDLKEIETIFKAYWMKEILNISLLITPNEVYSYHPFFNEFAVKISGEGKDFFPDKLINLNGHQLRMSRFIAALDTTVLRTGKIIGRDIDLWKTIVNEINATYIYIPPLDGITYGLKFKNGTMTGVFHDVVKNITDIAVNSRMVKLMFENVLEHSYPHDREDVTVILPAADSIAEFIKFVMLFSVSLWFLVGSIAIGFGILWWIFVAPKHPLYAFFCTFTLTLGNPIREPSNVIARMILLTYTSWIFFIQAAYHGTLTSVLTVPLFAPEIDTLKQLEKSTIDIYAATRFKDMFLANLGGSLTPKLVNRIKRVKDDPDIERLVKKRGHYAIVQKETFAMLSILTRDNYKSDGSQIYRPMAEKPMPTQVCYAARYGSYLLPKINSLLRKFQEEGLVDHWKEINIHRIMLDEKYGDIPAPKSLRVLTFDNISIAFIALAFGLSLAFVGVLIEKCIFYCNNTYN